MVWGIVMELGINGSVGRSAFLATGLASVDELYDLARDKSPQSRRQLTQAISEVLETELSFREAELVSDVLIALLKQAEHDFRKTLAERLSIMDGVPLRLVLHMANEDIDIARPVLQKSSVLGEFDLLYIIKSKSAEYWRAIATRESLSEQVVDVLADCNDFETALALAENTNITLSNRVLNIFAEIAQGAETLAVPLLRRDEVSEEIASMLYRYVSAEIRSFIVENYDVDVKQIDNVISEVEEEFTSSVPKGLMPEDYMIEDAREHQRNGSLTAHLMLSALRRGHIRSFVAQMSVYTGLSCEMIGQVLSQTSGQGLAVIAKAYDFEKSDFISMFMLTNKIWNYGRIVEMNDLHRAIGYYERATKDVTSKILSSKKAH